MAPILLLRYFRLYVRTPTTKSPTLLKTHMCHVLLFLPFVGSPHMVLFYVKFSFFLMLCHCEYFAAPSTWLQLWFPERSREFKRATPSLCTPGKPVKECTFLDTSASDCCELSFKSHRKLTCSCKTLLTS